MKILCHANTYNKHFIGLLKTRIHFTRSQVHLKRRISYIRKWTYRVASQTKTQRIVGSEVFCYLGTTITISLHLYRRFAKIKVCIIYTQAGNLMFGMVITAILLHLGSIKVELSRIVDTGHQNTASNTTLFIFKRFFHDMTWNG